MPSRHFSSLHVHFATLTILFALADPAVYNVPVFNITAPLPACSTIGHNTVERQCSVCTTKASCWAKPPPPPPTTTTTTTTPPAKGTRPECMCPRRTTTWFDGSGHFNEWRRNAWRSKKQGNENNAHWNGTGTFLVGSWAGATQAGAVYFVGECRTHPCSFFHFFLI